MFPVSKKNLIWIDHVVFGRNATKTILLSKSLNPRRAKVQPLKVGLHFQLICFHGRRTPWNRAEVITLRMSSTSTSWRLGNRLQPVPSTNIWWLKRCRCPSILNLDEFGLKMCFLFDVCGIVWARFWHAGGTWLEIIVWHAACYHYKSFLNMYHHWLHHCFYMILS